MADRVECLDGGIAVDDRGQIQFCNAFDMQQIRRFYIVSNHQAQFIRAWHGHKKESKYVFVISGAAIVAAVRVDNWQAPDKTAEVERFILSEKKPRVLRIPAGYAQGFKTLLPGTRIAFFSTSTLAESLDDDYRYPADYWDPWQIEER